MSVETARSVVWTFKEFKGQKMGDLIDKGLIGFNNLGYAIERAYDPNVQRASRVLLTHLLLNPDQIKSSNNLAPLNVIKSGWRSFSERRQLQLSMLGGVLVGVLFGIAFAILFTSVVSATNRTSPTPARFESSPLTLGGVYSNYDCWLCSNGMELTTSIKTI